MRCAEAGLDRHAAQLGHERAHAAQALEAQHDATLDGHRAAREPGAAAAGNDRDAMPVAPAQHARDRVGVLRTDDGVGRAPRPRWIVASWQ